MSMDYFRRPQIAGNALKHLPFATVRGATRRNDPDGVSVDPYFPTVEQDTLTLRVDGINFAVTFPDDHMSVLDVLSTINAALVSNGNTVGVASEVDGVLVIQSMTKGSKGTVEVTGGTAALKLGFDLRLGRIRSAGGDLLQTGEARVNNPHGATFPVKNENLSTDSMVRAMGRLASNMDVLHSEHLRAMPVSRLLGTISAGGQTVVATGYAAVTCPGADRTFIGYGFLSAQSSPEELAAFFTVVDSVTRRPAQCRVVSVVRGDVTGAPPYSNAVDLNSPGNVLGQSFLRAGPIDIEEVLNGRVVYTSAGGFLPVKVGDTAEITGTDGQVPTDPWDNRGLRWIVEAVSSDGCSVTLRPMSKAELAFYGSTVDDSQPIVALNTKLPLGMTYGKISFRTGTFLEQLKLIVTPPLPAGATYQVWGKTAKSFSDLVAYDEAMQSIPALRDVVAGLDSAVPGLLTRPTFGWDPGSSLVTVGEFYVRWRGKPYRIPSHNFTAADGGTVYWDPADALVKWASSGSPVGSVPMAEILGSNIVDATRILADGGKAYMVGAAGQFPTIQQCFEHIRAQQVVDPTEIVLLEDQSFAETIEVPNGSYRIRGATPGVRLQRANYSGPLFTSAALALIVSDLQASTAYPIFGGALAKNCVAYNVGSSDGSTRVFVSPDLDLSIDNAGAVYITCEGEDFHLAHRAYQLFLSKTGAWTQVSGYLRVKQNAALEGDLSVVGSATISTNLSVTGTGAFHGNLSTDGSLSVAGAATVTGNISTPADISGRDLTASRNLSVAGAASVGNGLSVTGNASATQDLSAGRDLTVQRNTNIGGYLSVTGTFSVTAGATFSSTAVVQGLLNAKSTIKGEGSILAYDFILSSASYGEGAVPHAGLRNNGTTGYLQLGAAGLPTRILTRDSLDLLVNLGNADTLHSHPQYAGQGTPPATSMPAAVGAQAIGVATKYAREDHIHAHGAQSGALHAGTLHEVATQAIAGFMSAADKTKLDSLQEPGLGQGDKILLANSLYDGYPGGTYITPWGTNLHVPRMVSKTTANLTLTIQVWTYGFVSTNKYGDQFTYLLIGTAQNPGTGIACTVNGSHGVTGSGNSGSSETYWSQLPDDGNYFAAYVNFVFALGVTAHDGFYLTPHVRMNEDGWTRLGEWFNPGGYPDVALYGAGMRVYAIIS